MDIATLSVAVNQNQVKMDADLAIMGQAKQFSEQTG